MDRILQLHDSSGAAGECCIRRRLGGRRWIEGRDGGVRGDVWHGWNVTGGRSDNLDANRVFTRRAGQGDLRTKGHSAVLAAGRPCVRDVGEDGGLRCPVKVEITASGSSSVATPVRVRYEGRNKANGRWLVESGAYGEVPAWFTQLRGGEKKTTEFIANCGVLSRGTVSVVVSVDLLVDGKIERRLSASTDFSVPYRLAVAPDPDLQILDPVPVLKDWYASLRHQYVDAVVINESNGRVVYRKYYAKWRRAPEESTFKVDGAMKGTSLTTLMTRQSLPLSQPIGGIVVPH